MSLQTNKLVWLSQASAAEWVPRLALALASRFLSPVLFVFELDASFFFPILLLLLL